MLWAVVWLVSRICTVSPSRTRSIGPGTVPPNVQNVYSTPLASVPFCSVVSSSTITLAAVDRSTGGGAAGGVWSTAVTSGSPPPSRRRCAPTVPTSAASITTTVTISVTRLIVAPPRPPAAPGSAGTLDRSARAWDAVLRQKSHKKDAEPSDGQLAVFVEDRSSSRVGAGTGPGAGARHLRYAWDARPRRR